MNESMEEFHTVKIHGWYSPIGNRPATQQHVRG
jgi:hypothetical protein